MRKLALILALAAPGLAPELASAQIRHETYGAVPYDFDDRNRYASATLREARRNGCGCGAGGGSGPGSATYAVGNWTQVNMNLGDGANGMINLEEHQNNWGNGTATSNVDSQNSLGDQSVNNGGDWNGQIEDQIVGGRSKNTASSEGGAIEF